MRESMYSTSLSVWKSHSLSFPPHLSLSLSLIIPLFKFPIRHSIVSVKMQIACLSFQTKRNQLAVWLKIQCSKNWTWQSVFSVWLIQCYIPIFIVSTQIQPIFELIFGKFSILFAQISSVFWIYCMKWMHLNHNPRL